MRRAAVILVILAAAAVLVAGRPAGDDGGYEVRAVFDNAAFLVPGEDVRVAGARVGSVESVDVTDEDEPAHEDGSPEPGKAVVVLRIDDPGFRDFRADASCLIRPQSLLGEKFVECKPTMPRAAGSEPPPPLAEVPEGEPGEGQRFLPVESTGKAVDLDLVQNVMREPYPDRFRIILNELGAGLAARGEELAEIVDRANPALRETNEVLAVLADQRRDLARLARDGDRVLAPLARERDRVSGFIRNATTSAEAAAERRADLEGGIRRLPAALRELRLTMPELGRVADAATPVLSELGAAAPSLVRASEALGPFSDAATGALASLGDAAARSQGPLVASDPVIRDIRGLATSARPAATNLERTLRSLRRRGGFEDLLSFIYFSTGAFNGFDQYGHFLRAFLLVTNCNSYTDRPLTGCSSNFRGGSGAGASSAAAASAAAASSAAPSAAAPSSTGGAPALAGSPASSSRSATAGASTSGAASAAPAERHGPRVRPHDAEALLDYLVGEEEP